MPQFSNRPPKDSRGYGLPLVRTPANGRLLLAITSDDMLGCFTHWYGGRTVPCEQENCKACNEGTPYRWHGYVAGLHGQTRRQVIAEFTAQACDQIVAYRDANGTLRGAMLSAHRHKNRHNGRVLVAMRPGDLQALNLPHPPDLLVALSIIWNIAQPQLHLPDLVDGIPRVTVHVPRDGNNDPARARAK